MAGLGEACSHIAAVLFTVEAAVSLQENATASTSKKCVWNKYYKQNVECDIAEDIDYSHPRHNRENTREQKYSKGQNVPELTVDEVSVAMTRIHALYPQAGICIKAESDTDTATDIEENALNYSQQYPPLVYCVDPALDVLDAIESIKPTQDQVLKLNEDTKAQASSSLWRNHRKGRITSTTMREVIHALDKDNVVQKILQYDAVNIDMIPAVKWGHDNEQAAFQQYLDVVSSLCRNLSVEKTGLIVSMSNPYIAASPDGLRKGSCHGVTVIEIKCPFKFRDISPDNDEALNDSGYCLDRQLCLKKKHKYYTQVQVHMFVTGATACDFIVWTPKGIVITEVLKDTDYHNKMAEDSLKFFKFNLFPEITSKKLEIESETLDPTKVDCSCQRPAFGRMIMCGNSKCESSWFHYACVNIKRKPKGEWFCSSCKN
jgi:hypothetical protein